MVEIAQIKKAGRIFLLVALAAISPRLDARERELVPFGDFEQWTVRYIKESSLIGGGTKPLYMVAPRDTVYGNVIFDYSNTIWTSSNAYAVVAGITKTSGSVFPEEGPHGFCARMESRYTEVKVAGLLNIKVFSGASVFWGKTIEPIKGTSNPFANMDWGIPFSKRPSALVLDYKAVIPNTGKLAKGTKMIDGYDEAEIMLVLQNRQEDVEGNIHVKRVGTAFLRINRSTGRWIEESRIPVIYGDATKDSRYREYMNLKRNLYAQNSRGKVVPLAEEGWAAPDTPVTHAILSISTCSQKTLMGAVGNTIWVDNVMLEYE